MTRKMLTTMCALCMLGLLSGCADRTGEPNDAEKRAVTVNVTVEAEDVYGLTLEYHVGGNALGGQFVANANEKAGAFRVGEELAFRFEESDFQPGQTPEDGLFGVTAGVWAADESVSWIDGLIEWQAEYGGVYPLTLSKTDEGEYALEADGNKAALRAAD